MACAVALVLALLAGCTAEAPTAGDDLFADPGNCTVVPVATSPEKRQVVNDLALTFNDRRVEVDGRCVFIIPRSRTSATMVEQLASGWPTSEDDPAPALWVPASTTWGALLDERLRTDGRPPLAESGPALLRSPVVVAVPEPLARALGWPHEPVGWADLALLAADERGWGALGHAQWGPFRLGTSNPAVSTIGAAGLLSRTLGARAVVDVAAEPPTDEAAVEVDDPEVDDPEVDDPLTVAEIYDPTTSAFVGDLEQSVIHYGSDPVTFLTNWYAADQRGDPADYLSAAVVVEQSVIAYNQGLLEELGDPDGAPRPPRTPLVAIYPEGATVVLTSPLYVLDAPWVSERERRGAEAFVEFATAAEGQDIVRSHGFRPADPDDDPGELITPRNGADADGPSNPAALPPPAVVSEAVDHWHDQRRPTRLLVLLDTGDLDEPLGDDTHGRTRRDLVTAALLRSLDALDVHAEVALWVHGNGVNGDSANGDETSVIEVVPSGPLEERRAQLRSALHQLPPSEGRATAEATTRAFTAMVGGHDATRINAVLLVGPGHDREAPDSIDALVAAVEHHHATAVARPVRLFTVGFGPDAELTTLRRLAAASGATSYNASDPPSIDAVIDAAMANF
ncbi:MAG: substrate-binding domain-containing protein [Acidimicrobiia bacterium]|nr:substrate-binding domain-containing protein [Acidimicrobiia bacterium]